MKKTSKKGFTLAELLVVVAIIAVLIAISIPVFGSALAKAEHAKDLANVRAAYAEAVVDAMTSADYKGGALEVSKAKIEAQKGTATLTFTDGSKIVVVNGSYSDDVPVDSDVTFTA